MSSPPQNRIAARLTVVEDHVASENAGDLDGIVATFGEAPRYEDESWGERYEGQAEVRGFYETLIAALPDLSITVNRRHLAEDAIFLEVTISGTISAPGADCPPRAAASPSRSAQSTASPKTTGWPASASTTTAPRSSASSAFTASRQRRSAASARL